MKFLYEKTSLVSEAEIANLSKKLIPYASHLGEAVKSGNYDAPESSINLPSDDELFGKVLELKKSLAIEKLKYIVVVGIGGSNLGTQAIYDALCGYADLFTPDRFPKMIFVDTNNVSFLRELMTFLDKKLIIKEEVVINVISKSGGTIETMANAEVLIGELQKKFPGILNQVVVTTDFESKLWKIAQVKKIATLAIPKSVGGRYSVFSAVGLFPLALLGVDIEGFRAGALEARAVSLTLDPLRNPALISASILYTHYKVGKNINDNFFFNSELESLGKWYRQLMGESIGKEKDLKGNVVKVGITPTVSIGSTDLHSMGQLYYGGPKDKITTFMYVEDTDKSKEIPIHQQFFAEAVSGIEGRSLSYIMGAIFRGVKTSYAQHTMPFTEIVIDEISARSLGEYMQFKMIEIMYLAQLLEVNDFDQPAVELYKNEVRKILSTK